MKQKLPERDNDCLKIGMGLPRLLPLQAEARDKVSITRKRREGNPDFYWSDWCPVTCAYRSVKLAV